MRHHDRPSAHRLSDREIADGIAGEIVARIHHAGPSEDEIRTRAYFKWERAGWPVGDGVEFWLAAERELIGGR